LTNQETAYSFATHSKFNCTYRVARYLTDAGETRFFAGRQIEQWAISATMSKLNRMPLSHSDWFYAHTSPINAQELVYLFSIWRCDEDLGVMQL
jgi:hypothetical protein